MDRKRVEFVSCLRCLACLLVVISHYFNIWNRPEVLPYFTNIPNPPADSISLPLVSKLVTVVPLLKWGSLGVAIFFLISGFVIPFSFAKRSIVQFCVAKALRIWPTYLVGLSVTVMSILAGCQFFKVTAPFSWGDVGLQAFPGIHKMLIGRDIDGVIWTLDIEVQFYVLCLVTAHWLRTLSMSVFLVPLVLGVSGLWLCSKLPDWMNGQHNLYVFTATWLTSVQCLIYMYIGLVLHYLHAGAIKAEQSIWLIAALFTFTCLVWSNGAYSSSLPTAWNYAFAIIVFGLAMSNASRFKPFRLVASITSISYPLYASHGVAGYVLMRVLQHCGWSPNAAMPL